MSCLQPIYEASEDAACQSLAGEPRHHYEIFRNGGRLEVVTIFPPDSAPVRGLVRLGYEVIHRGEYVAGDLVSDDESMVCSREGVLA